MAGLRWMKYKEGFSKQLVADLIAEHDPEAVLDPFMGIGTTPLVAAGKGRKATGIDIMPIGAMVGTAIADAANGLSAKNFERQGCEMLDSIRNSGRLADQFAFPHVTITEKAFSPENEREIAPARAFLSRVKNRQHHNLLNMACLSILESVSYTRKDGQYLRWDGRSGRPLKSSVDKGPIPSFSDALEGRLAEIVADIAALKKEYGKGYPEFITGSCLSLLKDIPSASYDMVITSPPYANRYDYTRTYALELAWLDIDREGLSMLRQQLLSATVENKAKLEWLDELYGVHRNTLDHAIDMHANQGAINEGLAILQEHQQELSNKNVMRLVEQYFLEMAVVIAELGRILRPGGTVIMVNDNVQYHGEEFPVDFILSDFAEQSGFNCTNIWKLARGKGNSSQQMARFGRRELRKCVYKWVRQ